MHTFEQKPSQTIQSAAIARPAPRPALQPEALDGHTAPSSAGFDFSQIPIHPTTSHDDPLGATETDQQAPPMVSGPAGDTAEELRGAPKIDELKVITSNTGAFSDFPTINGVDLNKPGPFNDTTTSGTCVNVHQMQFHLAKGDPNEVKLIRKVVRVASAGGKTDQKGEKDKLADDGPSAPTVIRPKDSPNVVVADSPGFVGKGDPSKSKGVFPVTYDADFELFATDIVQPKILAKLVYSVHVAKQSFGDTSPKNEIVEKSRKLS